MHVWRGAPLQAQATAQIAPATAAKVCCEPTAESISHGPSHAPEPLAPFPGTACFSSTHNQQNHQSRVCSGATKTKGVATIGLNDGGLVKRSNAAFDQAGQTQSLTRLGIRA